MSNNLFIGNRVTNVFIVDISTGVIVSKITNNNEEDILHRRPAHSNNLATIIRIDYTLKSINREKGDEMWNVTTSEIMVIEKGSKHELTYNPTKETSRSPQFQENLLAYQVKKQFNNENLNSIVNVYKFKKDAPYKIFDSNNTVENNFKDYVDHYISPRPDNSLYDLFQDYYKWKSRKIKNFTFDELKRDIYFADTINHFHFHFDQSIIIFILIVFILILIIFNVRTWLKKQILKNELDKKNQTQVIIPNNDSNSNSTSSTSNKENSESKEDCVTSLVKCTGYVKKSNLEGNYYEEPNLEEKALPNAFDEEPHGINVLNNLFSNKSEKPIVLYDVDNSSNPKEFLKIERKQEVFEKKTLTKLNQMMEEEVKIIEGAELVGKKLEIGIEETQDKIIITKDLKARYRTNNNTGKYCLPCGDGNSNSNNNLGYKSSQSKFRTSSMDFNNENSSISKLTGGGKFYKEDQNISSETENLDKTKLKKKKIRSCSPVQKSNISNIIPQNNTQLNNNISNGNENELRYTSDVSSDEELQLNIMESDAIKQKSNNKLSKISEKIAADNLKEKAFKGKGSNNAFAFSEKFQADMKSLIKKQEETVLNPNVENKTIPIAENSARSNNSKSQLISFESISNYNIRSKANNKIVIKHTYDKSKKFEDSQIVHSKIENSLGDAYTIKSPYSKVLRDNIDRLDNGRFKKDFTLYDRLGEGGFGCVHKVKHRLDGSYYAVKIIELEVGVSEYLKDLSVLKEVKTMLKLQHKNVVRYFNCWFESKNNEIELKKNKLLSKKSIKSSRRLKHTASNLSETVDIISKQSLNSSNLGIKFENEKAIYEENKESENPIEEEPQEIFSESEDDQKKGFSIDYEKNSSEEKKYSVDDSKLNNKRPGRKESMFSVLFYMQMEYCGNETLHEFLQKREKSLDRKTIFLLFKQIALGVAHIHKNGIIHRDLKPANIFMIGNNKINLKIGDFGLATDVVESKGSKNRLTGPGMFNSTSSLMNDMSVKFSENVGTPLYQSPEQIKNLLYNEKVDIYSLGLILLEICSFFRTYHERKLCLENVREHGIIPEKIKENYPLESQLITAMTAAQPSQRPSAQNLLKFEAFRKLEEEFDASRNK